MERREKTGRRFRCHSETRRRERSFHALEEAKESLKCGNTKNSLQVSLDCKGFVLFPNLNPPKKQSQEIIPIPNVDSLMALLRGTNVILL